MAFHIKRFKPLYWLYNLLHYRYLLHNKNALKEYGIDVKLYATLSSKNFPDKTSKAWLDMEDSNLVASTKKEFTGFAGKIQAAILNWSNQGYLVLPSFLSKETCSTINTEVDHLLQTKKLHFENGNKIMFANRKSAYIKEITLDGNLCSILSFVLGKEVVPFQTINFLTGSEQRGHSDSIHMTTYPLGYLIAVWIALEDITVDNGPLFYYPQSHKLPFVLNDDFNEGENFFLTGKKSYVDYEDVVDNLVHKKGYKKEIFLAKKGDVFIWHANLVHGGSKILNKNLTRKSMVIHYFAKDVIKYHEITERPTLLKI